MNIIFLDPSLSICIGILGIRGAMEESHKAGGSLWKLRLFVHT